MEALGAILGAALGLAYAQSAALTGLEKALVIGASAGAGTAIAAGIKWVTRKR
jgi:hypothetical protein